MLDASNCISRNIAEGYCRISIKEYLHFLNIALGSEGELYSGIISLKEIDVITAEEFSTFDKLHYKTEKELLSLIKAIQKKQITGDWKNSII